MTDELTGTPADGALAPRPTPEPCDLECPGCGRIHLDQGEWRYKPHRTHACAGCGHEWRPSSHCTVGVDAMEDLDRERLIHESLRIEAALDHFEFPAKTFATESSFDRVLDALAAAQSAGHDLEDERDPARAPLLETKRALDSVVGVARTLTESLFPHLTTKQLTETERKILDEGDRLASVSTPRPAFDHELTRLRADIGVAKATIKSAVEGLIHEEVDEETQDPWNYCIVCDDAVTTGERRHASGEDVDVCLAYALAQILAHLERPLNRTPSGEKTP